jgi:outer membrane protein
MLEACSSMKIFFTIFFLSIATIVQGQRTWTFQECIRYATENNLELKNYLYNIESHRLGMNVAVWNFLPTLSAYTGYDINIGKTIDPNTNIVVQRDFFSNAYGIGGNLILFNGFRQINRLSFEKYNLLMANEVAEKWKNNLAYNVLEAYVNHLIQIGLMQIQQNQLDISKQELYRIQKHIELGMASGSERYEAESRLARDEFQLVQLQNLQKKSGFDLRKLMNLPLEMGLEINDIETDNFALTEDGTGLYAAAKSSLPEIKIMYYQVESSKRNTRMAKSYLFPTVSFSGRINTGFYETYTDEAGKVIPYREQLDNNRRMGYGISMNIPLFDGFYRRINVQRVLIEQHKAQNDLEIGLQNLKYDIEKAIVDYQGAGAEYEAAIKKEKSMEMAFTIAVRRREKGLISMLEYFEAKNGLAQASVEVLRTKLQLFLREKTLNFYFTGSFIE